MPTALGLCSTVTAVDAAHNTAELIFSKLSAQLPYFHSCPQTHGKEKTKNQAIFVIEAKI